MSDSKSIDGKAKILDVKAGLSDKLEGVKFEQAFDGVTIDKAEQAFKKKKSEFKEATLEEFSQLQSAYSKVRENKKLSAEELRPILESAFRIKSIAGNGEHPIATKVAKLLYEFCERAESIENDKDFKVIRLHIAALGEILAGDFDITDDAKVEKLLSGLGTLSGAK